MAVTAARLRAVVTADTTQGQRGLREFGQQVSATRTQANRDLGGLAGSLKAGLGSLGGMLAPLGVAAGVAQLLRFGQVAATAASDMTEAYNKVDVVFGNLTDEITAFARSSTTALGMSRTAAYAALGTFGNLFTSLGIGRQSAADMSQGLTQLAADLGSFNNIDPAVALDKLRAGIVGEAEPLRALGINLTAANTHAKALALGLVQAGQEMTTQAAVAARYALIMEQSANAQGDFARTADGLANASRTAAGELADLKANLGKLVEKPYTAIVRVVAETVGDINTALEEAPVRRAEAAVRAAQLANPAYMQMEQAAIGVRDAEAELVQAQASGYAAAIQRAEGALAQAQAQYAAAKAAAEAKTAEEVLAEVQLRAAQGAYDQADGERGFVGAASQAAAAAWQAVQAKQELAAAAERAAWGADAVNERVAALRERERDVQVVAVATAVLSGELSQATVEAIGLDAAFRRIRNQGANSLGQLDKALAGLQERANETKLALVAQAVFEGRLSRAQVIAMGVDRAAAMITMQDKIAAAQTRALRLSNHAVAGDYRQRMESAIDSVAQRYQSAMQKGAQFSINLNDMRGVNGDPLAPGANGPFESIYRLQAWVNDGTWAETAEQFGIKTKEQAQEIIKAFQMGNITPEVEAVIDVTALIDLVKVQTQAEATYKAFSERIAAAAGTDKATGQRVLASLFGQPVTTETNGATPSLDMAGMSMVLSPEQSKLLAEQFRSATNDALQALAAQPLTLPPLTINVASLTLNQAAETIQAARTAINAQLQTAFSQPFALEWNLAQGVVLSPEQGKLLAQALRTSVVSELQVLATQPPDVLTAMLNTAPKRLDFGGNLATAVVSAVERDLLAGSVAIEEQGALIWNTMEQGITRRAEQSPVLYTAFRRLAERAIEEALTD